MKRKRNRIYLAEYQYTREVAGLLNRLSRILEELRLGLEQYHNDVLRILVTSDGEGRNSGGTLGER